MAGKPSLAALKAFAKANRRKPGPVCSACLLPEDVRRLLIEGRTEGPSAIARYLRTVGHTISDYTVARHLREHVQ